MSTVANLLQKVNRVISRLTASLMEMNEIAEELQTLSDDLPQTTENSLVFSTKSQETMETPQESRDFYPLLMPSQDNYISHNISGHNLSDHNLSGHNLSGHNLSGHNLSGHNLSGHNLSGHNLSGPLCQHDIAQEIREADASHYVRPSLIEIRDISYLPHLDNPIKKAILMNQPIDSHLHVVIVISNPCLFRRRYDLAREFIARMQHDPSIILYVVETVYDNQPFAVTSADNPRHLQLTASVPLWHKENMINLGVRLLPDGWKAMAWIDADIEFENASWASDTLKVLNGTRDIVQIFSHAVDMDHLGQGMSVFNSFGYQYAKGHPYVNSGINYWHPGFAWACTREAYEKMGGLYEVSILGSGDNIMALALIKSGLKALNEISNQSYKDSVYEYQQRVKGLRLGYVPGVILHHFHGSKKNRKYTERWKILIKYDYSPARDLDRLSNGVLCPSQECPREMLTEIMNYFAERNEDECFSYV